MGLVWLIPSIVALSHCFVVGLKEGMTLGSRNSGYLVGVRTIRESYYLGFRACDLGL